MEQFEEMCRLYLNGSDEAKETILSFLNDDEKKTFQQGVFLYKMFTRPDFYKAVQDAVGEKLYKDLHKEVR